MVALLAAMVINPEATVVALLEVTVINPAEILAVTPATMEITPETKETAVLLMAVLPTKLTEVEVAVSTTVIQNLIMQTSMIPTPWRMAA